MKVDRRKKKKSYFVTVNISICGHFDVEARSEEEAMELARDMINVEDSHYGLDCPFVDYDYDVEEDSE
jgi:hypothetical protein